MPLSNGFMAFLPFSISSNVLGRFFSVSPNLSKSSVKAVVSRPSYLRAPSSFSPSTGTSFSAVFHTSPMKTFRSS